MFSIRYDKRVQDDIASLSGTIRKRIKEAVEEKLTTHPELFGKPLRHSLVGFRSLRVGDYRVVYLIEGGKEVFVVLIAHRKDVYKVASKKSRVTPLTQ